jgi:hypothetical protein
VRGRASLAVLACARFVWRSPGRNWDSSLLLKGGEDGAEVLESGFKVFGDVFGEVFGIGEIVEVGKALVFEPGDVEAGFIAGDELGVGEPAPAAVGALFGVPGLFTGVAVGWLIARDEVGQVLEAHGVALEGVMDVGAVVVVPNLFGPGFFGGGLIIEEEDVGFNALGVEKPGGQAQDGMQVGVFEELFADGFAGAPSKRTLSGITTAAEPVVLSMVRMCWRKLSCLLELVAQKSWRL